MQKEDIKDLKIKKVISQGEYSTVYELEDGRVFKKLSSIMLLMMKSIPSFDIEGRINSASPIPNVEEILIPLSSVYEYQIFVGYTIPKAKGKELSNCNRFRNKRQFTNLEKYTKDYLKLEDIVKRANKQDIVFPDFLTLENIFVDIWGHYQFIDYEGIQIKNNFVMAISNGLGDDSLYENSKYKSSEFLYTDNLDKKSLIYYYFNRALSINLAQVEEKQIPLDAVFSQINLTDYDFMQKIWIAMQSTGTNEYIGEDVLRMNENYTLEIEPLGKPNLYLKRYRKK